MTVQKLVLNPSSVPTSANPICVPNFLTTRHPISAPDSVVPTFVTIRHLVLNPIFNFVTIRHLVLNPNFQFCDHSTQFSTL